MYNNREHSNFEEQFSLIANNKESENDTIDYFMQPPSPQLQSQQLPKCPTNTNLDPIPIQLPDCSSSLSSATKRSSKIDLTPQLNVNIKPPPIIPPYVYASHKPGCQVPCDKPLPDFHDIAGVDKPTIQPNTDVILTTGPALLDFSIPVSPPPQPVKIEVKQPPIIPSYVFAAHNMYPLKPVPQTPALPNFHDLARQQQLKEQQLQKQNSE